MILFKFIVFYTFVSDEMYFTIKSFFKRNSEYFIPTLKDKQKTKSELGLEEQIELTQVKMALMKYMKENKGKLSRDITDERSL